MQVNDKKLKEVIAKYQDLKRRLPRIIGQVAVNFSKNNFRVQGFLDGGRVQDWKKRRGAPDKKKRALLVQSGRLKRSIGVISSSPTQVTIGTRGIVYGQIHNEGGVMTITPKQRAFFWAKFKETGNEFWERLAQGSKIHIPKRKFMGDSSDLQQQMVRKVRLELLKVFK
jgi:phage gpG-like protein